MTGLKTMTVHISVANRFTSFKSVSILSIKNNC
jgi:hypothetical protein